MNKITSGDFTPGEFYKVSQELLTPEVYKNIYEDLVYNIIVNGFKIDPATVIDAYAKDNYTLIEFQVIVYKMAVIIQSFLDNPELVFVYALENMKEEFNDDQLAFIQTNFDAFKAFRVEWLKQEVDRLENDIKPDPKDPKKFNNLNSWADAQLDNWKKIKGKEDGNTRKHKN